MFVSFITFYRSMSISLYVYEVLRTYIHMCTVYGILNVFYIPCHTCVCMHVFYTSIFYEIVTYICTFIHMYVRSTYWISNISYVQSSPMYVSLYLSTTCTKYVHMQEVCMYICTYVRTPNTQISLLLEGVLSLYLVFVLWYFVHIGYDIL